MTDPATPGQADVPAPTVTGDVPPSNPAVEAALDQLNAAKEAYRSDPSEGNKAAKQQAAVEVRYQRWLARGGPSYKPTKSTQALHDRHAQGNDGGEG